MKQNLQIRAGSILLLFFLAVTIISAQTSVLNKQNNDDEKLENVLLQKLKVDPTFAKYFKNNKNPNLVDLFKHHDSNAMIDSIVSASYDTSFQKMKNIFQYDEYGNISNFIREYYDEGEIIYGESVKLEWRSDKKLKSFTSLTKVEDGWVNSSKDSYTYDPSGNLISFVSARWDTASNSWVYTRKHDYTYDANHNMLSNVYSRWNNGVWENSTKYEYGYDANNNKTLKVYSRWTSGAWKNSRKYEWTYDTNNNQLSKIEYHWDDASSTWEYYNKYEWTYDTNNNLTMEIYYRMIVAWKQYSKTTYTYDGSNNLISQNRYDWNSTDSQWNNNYWILYTYDNNNNKTFENKKNWDATSSSWIDNYRISWAYNSNGKLLSELYEDYNGSSWEKDNETKFAYDADEHITEYIYGRNWNGSDWDKKMRLKFRYNSAGDCNGGSFETWYAGHWVSADDELFMPWVFDFNWAEDYDDYIELRWYFTTTEGYEYSVYYNGVTDVKENNVSPKSFTLEQNYPNPFNPSTKINYTIPNAEHVTLKIYDILGNEITTLVNKNQTAGRYNVNFDASNLTSGIYFYQITAGNFTKVHKMMLLK